MGMVFITAQRDDVAHNSSPTCCGMCAQISCIGTLPLSLCDNITDWQLLGERTLQALTRDSATSSARFCAQCSVDKLKGSAEYNRSEQSAASLFLSV